MIAPQWRAALWMGVMLVSFVFMAVAVRELLDTMGTFQVFFFRCAATLLLVLAALPKTGLGVLRTRRIGLHALRNVAHFGGQTAWIYSLGALPLATVFAIEFSMPVWTAMLAMPLLGERLNPGRVLMLVLGIVGIFVILRPGIEIVQPAALVMLAGSLCYAGSMVATKRLVAEDSAFAILFYMAAMQLPFTFVPALAAWVAPQWNDLPWIAIIGVTSFSAHYSMTRALRLADATLVVPIDFLRLPLIAVVGAILYAEPIDPLVMLGAAVIFAGTYVSLRAEARIRPQADAP